MSVATWFSLQRPRAAERVDLPAPQPFAAPVFIADAVTPLAGETVLSLLWRRLEGGDDQDV